ncbi:MAG: GIY-YIG nuclease family protein [Anaerolineae bacterium]
MFHALPRSGGSYIVLFTLPALTDFPIGRSRRYSFPAGVYAYVGSALGPGGLAARVGRHARGTTKPHWHIDHLLPQAELLGALVQVSAARLECTWAGELAAHAPAIISGFGASDCRCAGHLFRLGATVSAGEWIDWMVKKWEARWYALHREAC